jgi:hypothetical protein
VTPCDTCDKQYNSLRVAASYVPDEHDEHDMNKNVMDMMNNTDEHTLTACQGFPYGLLEPARHTPVNPESDRVRLRRLLSLPYSAGRVPAGSFYSDTIRHNGMNTQM